MQQSSPSSSTTSKAESPLQPKYDLEERHHKYSPEPKNGFRNKHQHPEPTRDFPYQCESCDMLFRSIDHLSDHQKQFITIVGSLLVGFAIKGLTTNTI